MDAQPVLSRADSTTSKVQSSYIYYDFHINSSLLLLKEDLQEFIWHLDDDHNLVKCIVERSKYGDVSIQSDDTECIVHHDPTLVDINYFNKDFIALLHQSSLSFFDIQEGVSTNKISTEFISLVNVTPLFEGILESSTKFLGLSSNGECIQYEVSYQNKILDIKRFIPMADDYTLVTSTASSSINKNKNIVYYGTSYGSPEISVLTKADTARKVVFKFPENYGNIQSINMFNNSLAFNYGLLRPKVKFIQSSSNKLLAKFDLSMIHGKILSF